MNGHTNACGAAPAGKLESVRHRSQRCKVLQVFFFFFFFFHIYSWNIRTPNGSASRGSNSNLPHLDPPPPLPETSYMQTTWPDISSKFLRKMYWRIFILLILIVSYGYYICCRSYSFSYLKVFPSSNCPYHGVKVKCYGKKSIQVPTREFSTFTIKSVQRNTYDVIWKLNLMKI